MGELFVFHKKENEKKTKFVLWRDESFPETWTHFSLDEAGGIRAIIRWKVTSQEFIYLSFILKLANIFRKINQSRRV